MSYTLVNQALAQPLPPGTRMVLVALAARLATMVQAQYPALWPETVRALLVHSARWTDATACPSRWDSAAKSPPTSSA